MDLFCGIFLTVTCQFRDRGHGFYLTQKYSPGMALLCFLSESFKNIKVPQRFVGILSPHPNQLTELNYVLLR